MNLLQARSRAWRAALTAVGFAAAASAVAQPALPRWEAGLGAIGLYAPDYRGADQMRVRAFPLPYFVYRGDWLRADREGLRARLFEGDHLQFNFSAGIGLPVSSRRNEARRGMPEIDWVGEVGPALNLRLARWDGGRTELDLRLPVRAAFALDSGVDYIGSVFGPSLRATFRGIPGTGGALLRISTGPLYATGDYHRFYYGVEPQYATTARPAYRPSGGYSGWDVSVNAVKFSGPWRVFAFVGADLISGARFEDSPLIRRSSTWSTGLGFAYVFYQSEERVQSRE